MLVRVAKHITKFSMHAIPILTSCVVECHRVGFKRESFDFAAVLMRPENRTLLDPQFKKKIEQIVRRPEKDGATESVTPCPFCGAGLAETELECSCQNIIPYCVATVLDFLIKGRHMVLSDWWSTPCCGFPALASQIKLLVEKTGTCPMCKEALDESTIRAVSEQNVHLLMKRANPSAVTGSMLAL